MWTPAERRAHERIAVRLPVVLTAGVARSSGEAVNLSPSGCLVATEARVRPGERVRLTLELGAEEGAVTCEALVARVPGAGSAGLHFGEFDDDGATRLGRFVVARLGYVDIGQARAGRATRVRRRLGSPVFWLLVLLLVLGGLALATLLPWFHLCIWGTDC